MHDIVEQHGLQGIQIRNQQKGIDNLNTLARDPNYPNVDYVGKTGRENPLLAKASGGRQPYLIDRYGKIHLGSKGMGHADVLLAAKEQGKIHEDARITQFAQGEIFAPQTTTIGGKDAHIPARITTNNTGRFLPGGGNDPKYGLTETQRVAVEDWLGRSNKPHHYVPQHGSVTPTEKPTSYGGPDTAGSQEYADRQRARGLRKQLAKIPGSPQPTLLQALGKADDRSRNAALQSLGHPGIPQEAMPTLRRPGVAPGGMGHGIGKVDAPIPLMGVNPGGGPLKKVGPGEGRLHPSTAPKPQAPAKFVPRTQAQLAAREKELKKLQDEKDAALARKRLARQKGIDLGKRK
jgi:hypothetical protein